MLQSNDIEVQSKKIDRVHLIVIIRSDFNLKNVFFLNLIDKFKETLLNIWKK